MNLFFPLINSLKTNLIACFFQCLELKSQWVPPILHMKKDIEVDILKTRTLYLTFSVIKIDLIKWSSLFFFPESCSVVLIWSPFTISKVYDQRVRVAANLSWLIPQLWNFLAVWPSASYLTPLCSQYPHHRLIVSLCTCKLFDYYQVSKMSNIHHHYSLAMLAFYYLQHTILLSTSELSNVWLLSTWNVPCSLFSFRSQVRWHFVREAIPDPWISRLSLFWCVPIAPYISTWHKSHVQILVQRSSFRLDCSLQR